MNNQQKKTNKAFTLVELMIVIVIIGILAAIIIPTVSGAIEKSRITADASEIASMNNILSMEAIYENIRCFEAYEVQSILAENGFALQARENGTTYWYDRETNSIVKSTENAELNPLNSGINNVYAAEIFPKRIEAVSKAHPSYLFVDKNDTDLGRLVTSMQSILETAKTGNTTYSSICSALNTEFSRIKSSATGITGNVDSFLEDHLENFNPNDNIYVDQDGYYTSKAADAIAGNLVSVKRMIFAPNMTTLPNMTGNLDTVADGIMVLEAVEIPLTIEEAQPDALTLLVGAVTVVTSNPEMLDGKINPACRVSTDRGTPKALTIPVKYTYTYMDGSFEKEGSAIARQDCIIMIPKNSTLSADVSSIFDGVAVVGEGATKAYDLKFDISSLEGDDGETVFIARLLNKDGTLYAYARVAYISVG